MCSKKDSRLCQQVLSHDLADSSVLSPGFSNTCIIFRVVPHTYRPKKLLNFLSFFLREGSGVIWSTKRNKTQDSRLRTRDFVRCESWVLKRTWDLSLESFGFGNYFDIWATLESWIVNLATWVIFRVVFHRCARRVWSCDAPGSTIVPWFSLCSLNISERTQSFCHAFCPPILCQLCGRLYCRPTWGRARALSEETGTPPRPIT